MPLSLSSGLAALSCVVLTFDPDVAGSTEFFPLASSINFVFLLRLGRKFISSGRRPWTTFCKQGADCGNAHPAIPDEQHQKASLVTLSVGSRVAVFPESVAANVANANNNSAENNNNNDSNNNNSSDNDNNNNRDVKYVSPVQLLTC
jgi:hypothetical protein